MSALNGEVRSPLAILIQMQNCQLAIRELTEQRDQFIKELHADGSVGVREVARMLSMSPAQVSRIGRGLKGGKSA